MILITGATGHFGKATIDFLLNKGIAANQITALVRNAGKGKELEEKRVNVVVGDYGNTTSLINAFKGIDKLLLISGTDLGNRAKQHENVINAAKQAGVKHIIYTSFERKNETGTSPIVFVAESHISTEKLLKESGMAFTILRNNIYIDMVPMFIGEKVVETGTIYFPTGQGKAGMVLRADMAEATANVLITEGHENKVYSFSNLETFNYGDVAQYITEVVGKQINFVSPSIKEYKSTLANAGVPLEYVEMFAGFASAQEQGEFDKTSPDVEKLLGRKPTSIKEYLKLVYS